MGRERAAVGARAVDQAVAAHAGDVANEIVYALVYDRLEVSGVRLSRAVFGDIPDPGVVLRTQLVPQAVGVSNEGIKHGHRAEGLEVTIKACPASPP